MSDDRIAELEADRDKWRTQHENAVACWYEERDRLTAERDDARAEANEKLLRRDVRRSSMTDVTPGLCAPCDKLVHERYWAEDHCVICDLEKQRDAFKERNHHAMDLARLLEAIAEHDCAYGDNCPTFGSRHYQCIPCVAREGLAKARTPAEVPVEQPIDKNDTYAFLCEAVERADRATAKFGPHPSVEFALCRVTEELGELAQAATATSKGRDINRRKPMREEALDTVAMVIRVLREFPDGRPRDSDGAFCTDASCAVCKAGEPCH